MDFQKILASIQSEHNSDNKNSRVLLIDGMNTWIRICSSMPYMTDNGQNVGGIVGFLRSCAKEIRDFNATRCIIVFDGKGGSLRRRKIYPEYKQNRTGKFTVKLPPNIEMSQEEIKADMQRQLQRVIQYLNCLPIQICVMDNVEADDVIAYMTHYLSEAEKIRIVSTDRDFIQLVTDRVEVYSPVKKTLYTPIVIEEEFGISPYNYLLYRILTGDTSDNINGVHGLGLKTFVKRFPIIVERAVEIDEIIALAENVIKTEKKPIEIYKTVVDSKDIISRNNLLMQLRDVNISGTSKLQVQNVVDAQVPKTDKVQFRQMIIEDGLNIAFKNLDDWMYQSFSKLNRW